MEKLQIINRALSATGNTQLITLNDGSDEWIAADNAFERAVDFLVSQNVGAFPTKTADLNRVGDAARKPFTDAFQYPPDAWHLRTVFDTETGQSVSYTIIENKILAMQESGLRALYITRPPYNQTWHGAVVEYITMAIEAELQRGLNEDPETGIAMMRTAEERLLGSLTKVDQQSGPRQAKSSRAGAARRTRKA
jgi:hypothetical protein